MSLQELLLLQQGFNFAGTHGHLQTTDIELMLSMDKVIRENPQLVKRGLGKRKMVDFQTIQKLLLVKEEEKVAGGGKKADESTLKENALKKLYTAL